jgi:hypothetical protein
MKRTHLFLFILLGAMFAGRNPLAAQNVRSNASYADFLILDGMTVRVANLSTLDSLRNPHRIYFEMSIGTSDTKKALNSLLAGLQGQVGSLIFKSTNMQFQVIAEKDYRGITINEISFTDLNGSSRDISKVRVRVLAQDMTEKTATGEILRPQPGIAITKPLASNNFRLTLGSLTTSRVAAVYNMRIGKATGGSLYFNVDVERQDAKAWKDWFNSGGAKDQKQDGMIAWTDASFNNILFSLQFQGVEFLSVFEYNGDQQMIPFTTFGIHCRNFAVGK